jgi:hypothetical protein
MSVELPPLAHAGWTVSSLLIAGVMLALVPGLVGRAGTGVLVALFCLGLVIGNVLIRLTPFLAVEFPNQSATVGDLARDVLIANHALFVAEAGGWNKAEVWETLCRIIVTTVGVDREDITQDVRLTDILDD